MNIREARKQGRIQVLKSIMAKAKKEEINKEKLISMMIVNYGVSRKTALEEVEAVFCFSYE